MQVVNQKNVARRTLFYLSKMYVGSIKAGGKYADLKRTVTINIIDFEHNKFLKAEINLNDPLHRRLLFLDEKLPEPILKELIEMDPVIKKAEERLEWLSSDPETQRLYEAREYSLIEKNSLISEGKAEGKIEVARNLLAMGLDIAKAAQAVEIPLEDLKKLLK